MNNIWAAIQTAVWNIIHRPRFMDFVDILVVAVILYQLLMLTKRTRGSAVLKGLLFLLVITIISEFLGLTALNWLLMFVANNAAVVLVVLFQPELRKVLEKIGRGASVDRRRQGAASENQRIVAEIVHMAENLSRRKVGALVVFEQNTGLRDVVETGTNVDARISAPLLENIFEPKTPLHDGAVIIKDDRVIAAACILPLTEKKDISRDLGTRHRAGIGVSENSDALVLIVSEETGIISLVRGGEIRRRITPEMLQKELETLYDDHKESLWSLVKGLIRREAA